MRLPQRSVLLRLSAAPAIVVTWVATMGLTGSCPLCSSITNACGFASSAYADDSVAPPVATPPATPAPAAAAPATDQEKPAVTLGPMHGAIYKDLEGNSVNLADAAGKPMVIELWATWCGPCRTQRKIMHTMAEEFPDIVFVGASVDEKGAEAVKNYKTKYPAENPENSRVRDVMSTPQLRTLINRVKRENTIPQVIFVSRKGEITDVSVGGQNEKFMRAVLKNMSKVRTAPPATGTPATPAAPATEPKQPALPTSPSGS